MKRAAIVLVLAGCASHAELAGSTGADAGECDDSAPETCACATVDDCPQRGPCENVMCRSGDAGSFCYYIRFDGMGCPPCDGLSCCSALPRDCADLACQPGYAPVRCGGQALVPAGCVPMSADCGVLETGAGPYCCPSAP